MRSIKIRHTNTELRARETAISIHNLTADKFACQYAKSDPYYTAFLYGRKCLDFYFDREIRKLNKRAKILDVGCGTGDKIRFLLSKGFNAQGIEPAKEMLKYARYKLPETRIIKGSVLQLPFPDNYFDFVYALEVFRYLGREDNVRGLKEINRVLKPGCIFFGTFVNKYALDGFYIFTVYRQLLERFFHKPLKCHTEFETPSSLKKLFKQAGYDCIEICGAMMASLRILYKICRPLGEFSSRLLEPFDRTLHKISILRPFSGHLVVIARKKSNAD